MMMMMSVSVSVHLCSPAPHSLRTEAVLEECDGRDFMLGSVVTCSVKFCKQLTTLLVDSVLSLTLLRDYRITVFATCHTIRRSYSGPSSSSSSSEYDRPYLCRPWQRLVNHRLLCSRQEAANNMAATEGGSKEQRRWQVFTVHCTSSSSSSSRTKAYRSSSFYVTDGGVEFI